MFRSVLVVLSELGECFFVLWERDCLGADMHSQLWVQNVWEALEVCFWDLIKASSIIKLEGTQT